MRQLCTLCGKWFWKERDERQTNCLNCMSWKPVNSRVVTSQSEDAADA